MKSILSPEQMAAADNRSQAGGEEVGGNQSPANAPATEVIDQGGAETQEQGGSTEEVRVEAPEPMTVTLKDGRQLEVDGAEAQRLMQLGIAAGDADTIEAARGLEQFIKEDPRRATALKALIDNPEAAEVLNNQFGVGGVTEGGEESPQEKEIRELKADNARLQNKADGGQNQVNIVAEAASKYPALKGLPANTLAMAVKGIMAEGQSLSSALVQLAAEQSGSEVQAGNQKRETMRNSDRLAGVGSGGNAPSAIPPKAPKNGNALRDGSARQAAQRRLANRS